MSNKPTEEKVEFTVCLVSSNTNSFGLYQHILVSEKHGVFETLFNELNKKKIGDQLQVSIPGGEPHFPGGECTHKRGRKNPPVKIARAMIQEALNNRDKAA